MNAIFSTFCKPQLLLPAGLWFVFVLAGCDNVTYERQLEQRNDVAEQKVKTLKRQVEMLERQAEENQRQIVALQNLGKDRLDVLVHVEKIKISKHTGGVSRNDKPGQDSIKIIFTPIDADGDVIKAAGSVQITLLEKAKDKAPVELAKFDFTPAEAMKNFAGGPLTKHYSFTLPLPENFKTGELLVKVSFTDYLTGKTFTAEHTCKIINHK